MCCVCVRVLVEVSDLLEMELQVAVSYLTWMLGTKFGSSGRASNTCSFLILNIHLFHFIYEHFAYMCVCVCTRTHSTHRDQKRASDPLELEL